MSKIFKRTTSALVITSYLVVGTAFGASQGTEGASPGTTSAPKVSSPSVANSSKNSNSTNMMGAAMNGAMGGLNLYASKKMYAACASSKGTNGYACAMGPVFLAMGLMNIAQAGLQLATAKQAGGSYGATSIDGGGYGVGGYDSTLVDKVNSDPQFAGNKEYLNQVAKPGGPFSYNPKTGVVTTKDGKKISAKDLQSPEAMAAAGMSPSTIAGVMDAMKGVEDAAKKKVDKAIEKMGAHTAANGFDESGGGGGGGSASASSTDPGAGMGLPGAGGGLGLDRDPAQVAGMQKDFNGEPIGVAGDSLFKMMTRRYKLKESQNSFFDGSELLTPK